MAAKTTSMTEEEIISYVMSCYDEAEQAKSSRMDKNSENFAAYQLEHDFSHKIEGQSKESLPKQSLATEMAANFIQQGLIDLGDWFQVAPAPGIIEDEQLLNSQDVQKLMIRFLDKGDEALLNKIDVLIKLGFLGSLMIAKVSGRMKCKPKYVVKEELKGSVYKKKLERYEDKSFVPVIELVRQEDFYPDPTGRKLYEIQKAELDLYQVSQLAEGSQAIYSKAEVNKIKASGSSAPMEQDGNKALESGQDTPSKSVSRHTVELLEFWGNILNNEGECVYENVTLTVANRAVLVRPPTPNPFWHQESPFVSRPVISPLHGVWSKAPMDAPTQIGKALNELFNLILDNGLMGVHGIKELREHWLEDPSQVENGIAPGTTLKVNQTCPPGMSALTRSDEADMSGIQSGLQVLNVLNQEFNASAMTNDLRFGVQSFRQVKATEVMAAENSIDGMYTGLAKNIEVGFLTPVLAKFWKTMCQNIKDMDKEDLISCLGKSKAEAVMKASNEEIFAQTVNGCDFLVFGVSATLNKQKDFTKLQAYMQTVGGSEFLLEEAVRAGLDFGKINIEILRSLDIDAYKVTSTEDEKLAKAQKSQPAMQGGPNVQSQIPQAGAPSNQGDMNPNAQFGDAQPAKAGGS